MTTILTKKKDTSGAPAPGDLTNAAGGAELAVNTADKRLYTKNSGGNVVEIGTNPTILNIDNIQIDGSTISSTNTNGDINITPNGTGSVVVSKLNVTGAMTFDGNVTVGNSSADTLVVNSTITSNLLFTDNTYDIGASGATRPRNIYLSNSAVVDANVDFGRPGVARGFAGFYPSTASAWFYIRNNNSSGLEFSSGGTPGSVVALTLAQAAGTSTLSTNLVFSPDNTYDIGANGATRPRSLFAGTGVNAPLGNFPNGLRISNAFDTGANNNIWWEIGTWTPSNYSNEIEIVVYGGASFSTGSPIAAKATILIRVNNTGGWNGVWRSEGIQGSTGVAAVAVNASTGKVYVQLGTFFQKQISVIAPDTDGWTTGWVNTGSGTIPVGATALSAIWQFSNGLITADAGNGCVSIGTSTINTSRKLYVYGGDILAERAGANVAVGIYSNGGSGRSYYMVSTTEGNWTLYDDAAAAARITVNSNGLVGINTAPKVWQAGISVLQLGAQASLSYGGGTNMLLGNNRYYAGGVDKFIASGNYATIHEMSNGLHSLAYSTVSGTADATISWAYALTTNQSGQVVLPGGGGYPTATAGYVLDVRGNILAYKASGNTSIVASTGTNANAAMNAYQNFGVEFNTDGSYTSYAWAQGATRKMWLIANDSGNSSLGIAVSNPQAYAANGVRCSLVTNQPIISNDTVLSRIQSRGYVMQDTGGSTLWTKFGTFYTSNNGYMCRIRYTGHVGFNANPGQLGMCEILFSTSNGSSSQAGSTGAFFGMFVAYRLGPANVVITVRVVQINTDTYEIWGYIPNYSNGGYYEVSFSDGQSWTHSGSVGTPSGNYVDVAPSIITYT